MPASLHRVPVVLLDCVSDDPQLSSVVPDEYGAAHGAVTELLDHGHRRIGFITNVDDVPATHGRLKGYRDTLTNAGIRHDPHLVAADVSETPGGYRTATRLLTQPNRQPPFSPTTTEWRWALTEPPESWVWTFLGTCRW